jgi:hypothetical protein
MTHALNMSAVHPAGAQADEEAEAAGARRQEEKGRQEGPQSGGFGLCSQIVVCSHFFKHAAALCQGAGTAA